MNLSQRILVSTKGKIFNTPWDHARPGHGQRGALACWLPATPEKSSHLATALTGTSHLLTWCPPVQHRPCSPALCAGGAMSPSGAVLGHSGGAHMCCSLWAPSIPPIPGLPGSSFWAEGQQERPPHSLGPSLLYLQLSVGKQGFVFVLKGGGSGQGWVLVALGQFALCHRLLLFFSGAMGQNLPRGRGQLSLE